LHHEKEALRKIGTLLEEANIPWWVDCGTCLGAYRYGGVIPWDEDVDIAVLMPDFDNVKRVLNQLDPSEYTVQDWSSREHPKSFMKVYVRKSGTFVDIYHFKILPETRQIQYVLSLEHAFFLPDWMKIREQKFTVPAEFDSVFPLKKMTFDNMTVFVPNKIEKYLQRYYGENLAPAKVFDPITNKYEKDLTHPYWLRAYVH
jgi:phosphorylcholine metabolism protein LicD